MNDFSIIISCGGTGGHFYPGLSLGREFKEQGADVRLFVAGKHSKSQQEQAVKFNIAADTGRALRLPRSKMALPFFALLFSWTVLQSVFYLLKKRPKAVLVMGSFAGVPLGLAAVMTGTPLFLHEGNTVVGKANRFLSRWARKLFLSFEVVNSRAVQCSTDEVGMPLRPEILKCVGNEDTAKWKKELGFDADKPLLMVFGGSQGAMKINNALYESLGTVKDEIQLIHLTGQSDNSNYEKLVDKLSIKARVETATDSMADYFRAADLTLCRAGASSLAELVHFRKAALFVPLKIAAENHQYRNAQLAVKVEAAVILNEEEFSAETLGAQLKSWLLSPGEWHTKAQNMSKLSKENVSKIVVKSIVESC